MVRVIMGKRGSGKTKKLIELVNHAVGEEIGSVVCIEKGQNLRFNIKHSAKLIDLSEYKLGAGYDVFYAFLCGLYSGNYDITHVFLDSISRLTGDADEGRMAAFLDRLERLSQTTGVKFTLMISADREKACDGIKKFLDPNFSDD